MARRIRAGRNPAGDRRAPQQRDEQGAGRGGDPRELPAIGAGAGGGSAEQFLRLVREDFRQIRVLAKDLNIKANQALLDEADRRGTRAAGRRVRPAAQWAIEHQIKVRDYLGAADFVPVTQAHIMADTESLGLAGVEWLERMASLPAPERRAYSDHHRPAAPTSPPRIGSSTSRGCSTRAPTIAAFEALGVLMTNTCINYQTIMPPVRGEHVGHGDTGVVIYSNSVCGARSNFEGGPSALSAGLPATCAPSPDARRAATLVVMSRLRARFNDWGALGGIASPAGRRLLAGSSSGRRRARARLRRDEDFGGRAGELRLGRACFYIAAPGTPEAQRLDDVIAPGRSPATHDVGEADIRAFARSHAQAGKIDLVVFSAPQLSLVEMAQVAGLLDATSIPLLVITSPQVKPD